MQNIRTAVFETNSSSSHSLSIGSKCDLYDTLEMDSFGKIYLTGGSFQWGPEEYEDALTKANYCAQDQFNDKDLMAMLREVIMEHTGAADVEIDPQGDVDHQSVGTAREAFASKSTLKEFIFNPYSILIIDNDNH